MCGIMEKGFNEFTNSIIVAIIAAIGFMACLISFVLAIMDQKYIIAVLFFLSSLYCLKYLLIYRTQEVKVLIIELW